MCPEFLCGVAVLQETQAQETVLAFFVPSSRSLVWLLTGVAIGVCVGCFGATVLRPCAALQIVPVAVAVAALYAAAYLS